MIYALYIHLIIFSWGVELPFGAFDAPAYLVLAPFVLTTVRRSRLVFAGVCSTIILAALLIIDFSGTEIANPTRSAAIGSVFPFAALSAFQAFKRACSDNWRNFLRLLPFFLSAQVAVQITELLGLNLMAVVGKDPDFIAHYFLPINRASGLFNEPSHLAVAYSPLVIFLMLQGVSALKSQPLSMSLLAFSVLVCPSATLLATLVFALVVAPKPRQFLFIPAAILLFLFPVAWLTLSLLPSEIQERVDELVYMLNGGYLSQHSNTSAAVLIGGATAAWEGIKSNILGLGIGNLQIAYEAIALNDYRYYLGDRNIRDGGSILFKIIGEFGIAGVLASAVIFYSILRMSISNKQSMRLVFLFPFLARTASAELHILTAPSY